MTIQLLIMVIVCIVVIFVVLGLLIGEAISAHREKKEQNAAFEEMVEENLDTIFVTWLEAFEEGVRESGRATEDVMTELNKISKYLHDWIEEEKANSEKEEEE